MKNEWWEHGILFVVVYGGFWVILTKLKRLEARKELKLCKDPVNMKGGEISYPTKS